MTYIKTIEEYPIPFDEKEIIKLQESSLDTVHGIVESEDDIIENIDEFHDEYIDEMTRTDEWSVFRCSRYWDKTIYFWNHQLGYGLVVDGDWETMCPFVEMMEEFTEEYSSEDFEPPHYSWDIP